MKKVVLKLDLHDNKCRQKAMKIASSLLAVDSVALDKDEKLTVIGDIDPVEAAKKLKKLCHTIIVSVGPAKEPEKKKGESKKDEEKKAVDTKKDQSKDVTVHCPCTVVYHLPMLHCYPPIPDCYLYGKSIDEDPAACVIC